MTTRDVIIVGAGPAGSVCAAVLAKTGRNVLLVDRARFPRHKVCGDCLNPSVWPVFERLGLRERVLALPHTVSNHVTFRGEFGERVEVPISGEYVVKRRDLDALLAQNAVEAGAEFLDGVAVTSIRSGWRVDTSAGSFHAPVLVAADGRNSTVARLAGRLPPSRKDRVALQCHAPRQSDSGITMFFHRLGYGGLADLPGGELNLCLVAHFSRLADLRNYATSEWDLPAAQTWNTMTPLTRDDPSILAADGLFLVGDAARVVEPFTGEGIYYALRSGELLADALQASRPESEYQIAHHAMYRNRLWINRLARIAVLRPGLTSCLLRALRWYPAPLRFLTTKVVK